MKKADREELISSVPGQEKTFRECIQELPQALKIRFLKQMAGSIGILFLSVFFGYMTKSWECVVGLLFALYIAYIGMDIVWKYNANIIVRKTVRCISATKILGNKEQLYVVMRNLERKDATEPEIYKFYFPVSKKESGLFVPDVVLHIYINQKNPSEIIAWEMIDVYRPGRE